MIRKRISLIKIVPEQEIGENWTKKMSGNTRGFVVSSESHLTLVQVKH